MIDMFLNVQFELKNNLMYLDYIRNNSYWYKILTREPSKISDFKKEVKEFQKQQRLEKVSSLLHYVELMQTVANSLK